jgi:actin-related protein 9
MIAFGQALLTYLSPFLLSSAEGASDLQPAKARLLSIPEYFTNFKKSTNELAPFLGGSMVGKVSHTLSPFP